MYILIAVDILMYGFISQLLRWLCRWCSSWNASSKRCFCSRKDWSFLCLARYFFNKNNLDLQSPFEWLFADQTPLPHFPCLASAWKCKLHDFILDFCVGLLENMSMCHEFQKIQVSIRESLRLGKKCIAALPYTVFNGTTFLIWNRSS